MSLEEDFFHNFWQKEKPKSKFDNSTHLRDEIDNIAAKAYFEKYMKEAQPHTLFDETEELLVIPYKKPTIIFGERKKVIENIDYWSSENLLEALSEMGEPRIEFYINKAQSYLHKILTEINPTSKELEEKHFIKDQDRYLFSASACYLIIDIRREYRSLTGESHQYRHSSFEKEANLQIFLASQNPLHDVVSQDLHRYMLRKRLAHSYKLLQPIINRWRNQNERAFALVFGAGNEGLLNGRDDLSMRQYFELNSRDKIIDWLSNTYLAARTLTNNKIVSYEPEDFQALEQLISTQSESGYYIYQLLKQADIGQLKKTNHTNEAKKRLRITLKNQESTSEKVDSM